MGDGGGDRFLGEFWVKVSQISWTSLSQGAERHTVISTEQTTVNHLHSDSITQLLFQESSPLHLQFLTCTSASLSVSIRHLERIPFVPLYNRYQQKYPLTTLGLNGGVILLWYKSSQFIGLKNTWFFISSCRESGGKNKVTLLPTLLFQHLPAGFIALSG